jgi:Enoyl-CoA hydratase/isomerase
VRETRDVRDAVLGLDLDESGNPATPSVVLGDADFRGDAGRLAARIRAAPCVVVAVASGRGLAAPIARAADVVLARPGSGVPNAVETDDPSAAAGLVQERVAASPRASVALAWLLRLTEHARVEDAIAGESAAYSALLGGPDFRRWLAGRGAPRPASPAGRIRVCRDGTQLRITLSRPDRRNALDAQMRDAIIDALQVAVWDETVQVTIDATGPSFCSGGDLDEFGSAPDPATAHLVRVTASPGRLISQLHERVTVRVHGDCVGAGTEMPAFAGRVVADAGSRFRLPEIEMGLIPGAGGTVSLPRRIGRARTAWLALTGATIDAPTAAAWGLVDQVE